MRKTSVVEKKSSPLAQRKVMGGAPGPKRTSSGGELKSPTGSSTGGGARGGSNLPRPGGTDKTGVKKSSPNSTHRQVTSGKPPSGAHTTTNGNRSGLKQQPSGTTGRRTPTKERAGLSNCREKAGGLSNGSPNVATEKGGAAESQGERARKCSGGSTAGKRTVVSSVKKSGGTGGRASPARDRKTSVEKKPVVKSADSSPATLRRAGSVRRPGGTSSSSPGVVRRSSTLRRTGSSGSIPVSQRPAREKKADSESPKIERRVGNDKKTESVSLKTTGAKGGVKLGVKTGKTASPGARATESGRRGTGERAGGGPSRAGKQVPGATGINPAGRRSMRSRSEINIGGGPRKNDTQSLGRKISATSAIGRGSPSPSTLAGKAIILDHTGLQDEDRLRSTLKLFGAKSGAPGAKKTNRGQVIKSMGMATTSSGRSTPTWKNPHSASGVKLGMIRTGSGSRTGSVPTKTGPKSNTNSRPRLRSSEDVLKGGRRSPAGTAGKVRVTSPLSTTTVAPRPEKESQDPEEKATEALEKTEEKGSEKTEAENPEQSAEDSAKLEEASDETKVAEIAVEESEAKIAVKTEILEKSVETEAQPTKIGGELKMSPGLRGFKVSRPSCRDSQVKSKIANWKKIEEEARVSGSPSPIPPSPRSPSSTFSHISPTSPKVSSPTSHAISDPHTAPMSPPASPRATLTPRRSSEPHSSSRSRQRSQSPSPNLPVKSRIAMWAEKEREAKEIRSSLSPQRSPTHSPTISPQSSPKSTPRGLKRQSPVDKTRRSPGRSAGNSREGSVESNAQSLANSTESSLDASPSRQLPSITIKEENVTNSSVKDAPTGDEYEDVEVSPKRRLLPEIPVQETASVAHSALAEEALYSTIPDVFHEDTPPRRNLVNDVMKTRLADGEMKVIDIEDENEGVGVIGTEYTRPAPAYTEIDVLEDPRVADVVSQSVGPEMTPKSKRRWLRSPRFGRRKGSTDDAHSEGAASDKEEKKSEKEEKKSESFMKKIIRIKSRSGKDKPAVNKRRSAEATESDNSSSPEHTLTESRIRSSSELASDQLAPEVIPRSNSYSTSASPEVGYSLTSHQNLSSSSSQRVVSSNPTLSGEYGTATEKNLDPVTQRVVSNPTLQTGASGEPSSGVTGNSDELLARPNDVQQRRSQVQANDGALSHELRNLIDNFGEGGFCDEYSKKVVSLQGKNVVEKGTGSAPGGLRLPVRFELTDSPNHGSSHPNLVSVGFSLPDESGGPTVANGVGVRGGQESKEGSDSSTASEGEEQGTWEKEEEEDTIESSLDTGRATRYIKAS